MRRWNMTTGTGVHSALQPQSRADGAVSRKRLGRMANALTSTTTVRLFLSTLIVSAFASVSAVPVLAQAEERVFTVGNYPVEAIAQNAVAAKRTAIRDGQRAALRSLLKRLVPVTRYGQLRELKVPDAAEYLESFRVRSERNSSTEYVAEMDFSFDPVRVRRLLQRAGLPVVEEPAPETILIPIYRPPELVSGKAPPREFAKTAGQRDWRGVWRGLDLKFSLAPLKISELSRRVHPDTLKMVLKGEGGGTRILATEYGSERIVLADMQPDLSTGRLKLTLSGTDAVGPFRLERAFRFNPDEFDYALELSAVITHGILEGRWKSIKAPTRAARAPAQATQTRPADANSSGTLVAPWSPGGERTQAPVQSAAATTPIQVLFVSLGQWQQIRNIIESTPGVSSMEVTGLSTQSADVLVDYPPGGAALAEALSLRGIRMQRDGPVWVIR